MNWSPSLLCLAAIAITGCDLSENTFADRSIPGVPTDRSSLEAFADSLDQIRDFRIPSRSAARSTEAGLLQFQSGTATTSYSRGIRLVSSNHFSERSLSGDSSYLVEQILTSQFGPRPDSLDRLRRLSTTVTPFQIWHQLSEYSFATPSVATAPLCPGCPSSMILDSVFGRTRSGFRFAWSNLTESDSLRLSLGILARLFEHQNSPNRIVRFGDHWELVVPSTSLNISGEPDSLPLFQTGQLKGWLVNDSIGGKIRYPSDFSIFKVYDLDGRHVLPAPLEKAPWYGDSLGLEWGVPTLDSSGREYLVPIQWKFLPGTAETIGRAGQARTLPAPSSDTPLIRLDKPITSDEGSGLARIAASSTTKTFRDFHWHCSSFDFMGSLALEGYTLVIPPHNPPNR